MLLSSELALRDDCIFFFLSKVTGAAEIELVLVVLQCSRFGDYNDQTSDVKYMKINL